MSVNELMGYSAPVLSQSVGIQQPRSETQQSNTFVQNLII